MILTVSIKGEVMWRERNKRALNASLDKKNYPRGFFSQEVSLENYKFYSTKRLCRKFVR